MNEQSSDVVSDIELLNGKLRDNNARLHTFLNSLQVLVGSLDIPREDDQVMDALSSSLDALLDVVNASFGSLLVLDEDNQQLVSVLVNGAQSDVEMRWQRVAVSSGVSGWVLRQSEAAIINEVPTDERFDVEVDNFEGLAIETLMCVPVMGQNKNLGVLKFINKRVDGMFTDDDQTLALLMGRFAGELLQRMSE